MTNKTKQEMIEEFKKQYPSIEDYTSGKYFQARAIKAEQPQHTHTDWYEINGVSRSDFF